MHGFTGYVRRQGASGSPYFAVEAPYFAVEAPHVAVGARMLIRGQDGGGLALPPPESGKRTIDKRWSALDSSVFGPRGRLVRWTGTVDVGSRVAPALPAGTHP